MLNEQTKIRLQHFSGPLVLAHLIAHTRGLPRRRELIFFKTDPSFHHYHKRTGTCPPSSFGAGDQLADL